MKNGKVFSAEGVKKKKYCYDLALKWDFLLFTKGDNFYDFLFAFLEDKALLKFGSTLEGKNLLLGEQILSF